MTEIEQLREEIAKLRERIAVLEAQQERRAHIAVDWTKPMRVGSPTFIPSGQPHPAGTITCVSAPTPTKGPTP